MQGPEFRHGKIQGKISEGSGPGHHCKPLQRFDPGQQTQRGDQIEGSNRNIFARRLKVAEDQFHGLRATDQFMRPMARDNMT
jgi:hypothetical protein